MNKNIKEKVTEFMSKNKVKIAFFSGVAATVASAVLFKKCSAKVINPVLENMSVSIIPKIIEDSKKVGILTVASGENGKVIKAIAGEFEPKVALDLGNSLVEKANLLLEVKP